MQQLSDILSILKDKHKQMDQLMSFTKEMEKMVDMNDPEGLGTVLNMRQKTIDYIDKLNGDISKALSGLDKEQKDKIKQILESKGEPVEFENELQADIFNTNRMTLSLLQRVVDLDAAVSKKVKKEE